MKYLILIAAFASFACIAAGQKDPATAATECKGKFNITTDEEMDMRNKTFKSTSANSKVCPV